ncbi:MAG: hypothetical protein L3J66_09350 [Bacteroidales bacterium]|nr:hypothetical protein [Bacteroidales bacterium]
MITRLILLLLCATCSNLTAQEHLQSYTKKDGLTSSEITVTLVDSRGVVWLGTSNGLTAFSASKWYAIKNIEDKESGKPKALGRVEVLFEDSKRNLWVGSANGLFLFDGKSWTAFEKEDDNNFLPKEFMEDRQGRIWIIYEYILDVNASVQMTFSLTNGMLHMFNGECWISFNDILGGTAPVVQGYPSDYFTGMLQDEQGNIWLGSLEGAFEFDGHSWHIYNENDLKSEKVMFVKQDRQGNIWLGLDNGLARREMNDWKLIRKKDGMCGNTVYRMQQDNQDRIWVFVRNNLKFAGLNLLLDEKWKSFTKDDYQLKDEVESLTMYHNEVIAFSRHGLSVFRNNAWHRYTRKDGLADKHYTVILKDGYENVWLAGETAFYQLVGDKWEARLKAENKWGVKLIFTEQGCIWLGTEKHGVYLYSENKWKHFTAESGLADDRISAIFKDKKGVVWIVSKTGITRVLK